MEDKRDSARYPLQWPKSARLLKRKQFLELRNGSKSASTRSFLVLAKHNPEVQTRFGITVSKKVDKRAVQRNLIRRRVREVLRANRHKITQQQDLHVIARIGSQMRNFQEIEAELLQALRRLRILCPS